MGLIRKTRICLVTTLAVLLILLAVAFTLLRAFLPHATGYLADIEQGISLQTGFPVTIGSLDADMYYFTPRLKLLDVTVYEDDGMATLLQLDEVNVSLAFIDSIRLMMPMVGSVSLHGAEIKIERHPEGRWVVQGRAFQQGESSKASAELIDLFLVANLSLVDSRIEWRDFTGRSRDMEFEGVTLIHENVFGTHYLEANMRLPPQYGDTLRVVAEIEGNVQDLANIEAFIHINGQSLDLQSWVESTRARDYIGGKGRVDTELWFHIHKQKLTRISGTLSADDLVLNKANDASTTWSLKHVDVSLFWRELNEGWRLDLRDLALDFTDSYWRETSDVIVATHEADWMVLASYLKPADLLPALDILPDDIQIEEAAKYREYAIDGELTNLDLVFTRGDEPDVDLNAAFDDLQFSIPGKDIFVSGLDGEVSVDGTHTELELVSNYSQIDIARLFRWPIQLTRLEGKVIIDVADEVVRINSDRLEASNDDLTSVSRLSVEMTEGSAPFLDIQTAYANGVAVNAYRYIPSGILSDGLVGWLDAAFIDGYVPSGGFLFRGYANEFPFKDNQGVMQALFDVRQGQLHFLDGWPDVNNMTASVHFHNESLSVEEGLSVEDHGGEAIVTASIPDLKNALLTVNGDVRAPAEELQRYVWDSGLKKIIGKPVEHFQASGDTRVKFKLDVPLGQRREREGGDIEASGSLRFADNEMYFPLMGYQLTDLTGKLDFTTHNLFGIGITGAFEGQPLNIDVSTIEAGDDSETLVHISGDWRVNSLLKSFEWSDARFLEGTAHWKANVHVPHKVTDHAVMFDISSDLVGVKVDYSDEIQKVASTPLAFKGNLKILGDAQSINVTAGEAIDLSVNSDEDNFWIFKVKSPVIKGSGRVHAEFDADTTIDLNLDHLSLSAFVKGDGSNAKHMQIKAANVPSIKLKTKSLVWYDWQFDNVTVSSDQHSRGMIINEIRIDDPYVQVTGKGSWLRRSWRLDEETTFNFELSSDHMGEMLSKLGYSRYVDQSTMKATLNWRWPGEPYAFNWERLTGNSSIELGKGVLTDIEPGAGGRFLGLFNVLHLPKRLSLDFEDVYKEGFVFDAISGSYVFGDGDAITQDTEISASAANLTMMGRIGVADQDYELVAIVRPQSTVATFASGTLLGGPTIGVGLVVLQKIIGIDLLGKDVYSIEGPWENPVVKQISSSTAQGLPEEDEDFE